MKNSLFLHYYLIFCFSPTHVLLIRSSTLGLLRLSCWFTTVQEIVSITMTIMDTKDYLRGGPDGDKSVSISFTSVGKALASRSGTAGNAQHKYAVDEPNKSTAAAAPLREQGVAGAGEPFSDLMALEDISGGSEKSQTFSVQPPRPKDVPREPSTRAGLGAGATGASLSASASTPVAPDGSGSGGAAQVPQQTKMIDAGLRAIIGDMIRAIEVAVWDAAMER